MSRLLRRLRHWLRPDTLSDEMEAHIAFRADELREDRGLSERDALAQARREFGNPLRNAEDAREIWITRWIGDLAQDLRFAARTLAKSRGLAAVAILSSALGIGACSTVFGIANFVLFRDLPVAEPDRLLSISGLGRDKSGGDSISYPELLDLRSAKSLESVAGMFVLAAGSFSTGVESHRHWGSMVTANYFDVVRPGFALGRGFDPSRDDTPGAPPVIVLSHGLWQTRFGGDPSILGRAVRFNGRPVTVIGVAPAGFRGTELMIISEFWIPYSMMADVTALARHIESRQSRGHTWLMTVARLAPGHTIASARAEIRVLASGLAQKFAEQKERGFHVQNAGEINAGAKHLLFVFFALLAAVTVLVLLVASANVANLLLARASSRQKEIATRLAIGASRGRLIRQLLAESLLLSLAGGILGCILAVAAASMFSRIQLSLPLPLDFTVLVDYRILLFSILLSFATGVFFGLLPAWRATRLDLTGALKDETVSVGGLRKFSLRNALVIAQVAISMLLLICSGLFLRSLFSASRIPIGMHTQNIVFVGVDPNLNRYSSPQARQFFVTLLEQLRRRPGIEEASVTHTVPLSIGGSNSMLKSVDGKVSMSVAILSIGPRYFEAMGIALPQGTGFRGDPSDAETVILNRTAARRLFGAENPIGRSVTFREKLFRVVAVAADSKIRTIGEDDKAALYLPLYEHYLTEDSSMGFSIIARTHGPAAPHIAAIREQIRALDPSLAIFDIKTIETHLDRAMLMPRLAAVLFGICGGIALLISAIGLYGVISFTVARRTREIGIRMALGAERSRVLGLVLGGGLTLAAVGIVIGLGLSMALSRVAASLLYGISALDAATFVGVPLFLLGVALVAAWIPARRAASLDPIRTLRYE